MKQKNKRKGIDPNAPRCPYCGSHTILRSADGIYRENSRNEMLYVCKNYPACDAYVRVQKSYHRFPKMNSARKRGCRFWYYFPASEIARIRIPAASMARQRYCFF